MQNDPYDRATSKTTDKGLCRLSQQWVGYACVLDGKPAKIIGLDHAWATVRNANGAAYYAWGVVDNVMRGDRHFDCYGEDGWRKGGGK